MAFIVENGTGVAGANSYTDEAFALAYLTDLARETENSWSTLTSPVAQANLIKGTQYIETVYACRIGGIRQFLDLKLAKTSLTFGQNPADAETVVIGSTTYTFNTVLGATNSILIGANASLSLDNLLSAINGLEGEGTTYGTGTVKNTEVGASTFEGDLLIIKALTAGVAGNLIAVSTTVTGASFSSATLLGGSDLGFPQPLLFPRQRLRTRDGVLVCGVPLKVKQATVELAVRSQAATLNPDPETDDTGAVVTEKEDMVDVLKEKRKYEANPRILTFKRYPVVDRLLQEFVMSTNVVIRA